MILLAELAPFSYVIECSGVVPKLDLNYYPLIETATQLPNPYPTPTPTPKPKPTHPGDLGG